MIEYSDQESKIFNVRFGRVELDAHFSDWEILRAEAAAKKIEYLRLKIRDPRSPELDRLRAICKKACLLEILRVYIFKNMPDVEIPDQHNELFFKKTGPAEHIVLENILSNSYEDIPFGNYTPSSLLLHFPLTLQFKNLHDYFLDNYTGTDPSNIAFIISNREGTPIGCILTKIFKEKTYTYYVGIIEKYRHRDIMNKSINFLKHLTRECGVPIGEGSARLSNIYSQRGFEKNGMQCIGYDWIYLLEF